MRMKFNKFISLAVLGILLVLVISSTFTSAQVDESLEEIKNKIAMAACYILSILITLVAAVAVLFIILSGIKYITSGDDPTGRQEAKSRLAWALIGLTIALVACPLVDYLSIPPLQGGCYSCIKYGIIIRPPPGMVSGSQPGGPEVILIAEPSKTNPGGTIKFTCIAKDPDGIHDPPSGQLVEESAGLFGPIVFNIVGNPESVTREHSETFLTAGQWSILCWFYDVNDRKGWARISVVISDSTHPAAVIDSIEGKSLAELTEYNMVERDIRKRVYVKGHAEGGSGDYKYEWKVDGTSKLTLTEGWIEIDLGIHNIEFKVVDTKNLASSTVSVQIEVTEYIGPVECEKDKDCEAEDTDKGNKPEKKGTCYTMDCTDRGACDRLTPNDDSCSYHIVLKEYYPDPLEEYKHTCEYESINCYSYCGGRGGKCDAGKCQCFNDNCIMKPRGEFSGLVHLDDEFCHLYGTIGVGGNGYIEIKPAGTAYFYYKTEGTKCAMLGLSVTPSGHYNTISQDYDCTDGYTGKCRVTLSYYRDDENNEFYSACLEDVT